MRGWRAHTRPQIRLQASTPGSTHSGRSRPSSAHASANRSAAGIQLGKLIGPAKWALSCTYDEHRKAAARHRVVEGVRGGRVAAHHEAPPRVGPRRKPPRARHAKADVHAAVARAAPSLRVLRTAKRSACQPQCVSRWVWSGLGRGFEGRLHGVGVRVRGPDGEARRLPAAMCEPLVWGQGWVGVGVRGRARVWGSDGEAPRLRAVRERRVAAPRVEEDARGAAAPIARRATRRRSLRPDLP